MKSRVEGFVGSRFEYLPNVRPAPAVVYDQVSCPSHFGMFSHKYLWFSLSPTKPGAVKPNINSGSLLRLTVVPISC